MIVAREILVFLEHLDGISSVIKSDHILNLFGDLEGMLPDDKPRMLAILKRFLDMSPGRQTLYQVGRRTGVFTRLEDLDNPRRCAMTEAIRDQYGITPDNVEAVIEDIMRTFI